MDQTSVCRVKKVDVRSTFIENFTRSNTFFTILPVFSLSILLPHVSLICILYLFPDFYAFNCMNFLTQTLFSSYILYPSFLNHFSSLNFYPSFQYFLVSFSSFFSKSSAVLHFLSLFPKFLVSYIL